MLATPIFVHDGARPNLNAFNIGSGFSTSYNVFSKFKIGVDVLYQGANFHYNLSPRSIPEGNLVFDFSDKLNLRAIHTGLKIGYSY